MNFRTTIFCISFLALGLFDSCKKKTDDPPLPPAPAPVREEISYWMTVNPRAENKTNKDTLIIKLNGNPLITSKGSVADVYGPYKIKTNDKISIYYNPGVVVMTNSITLIDDNGLLLSLDYGVNNNKTLKEYSCRCIANTTITVE